MSNDVRNSLNAVRKLIKEAEERDNTIDLDGKANLHLNHDGLELDEQQTGQIKDFLKEFVDTVDQRITDFVVTIGNNAISIKTAIEGNGLKVSIDLMNGDNVNDQVFIETVGAVKLNVVDKLIALRNFLNPKRTEFLITMIKGGKNVNNTANPEQGF